MLSHNPVGVPSSGPQSREPESSKGASVGSGRRARTPALHPVELAFSVGAAPGYTGTFPASTLPF